jgi:hypothetical protein
MTPTRNHGIFLIVLPLILFAGGMVLPAKLFSQPDHAPLEPPYFAVDSTLKLKAPKYERKRKVRTDTLYDLTLDSVVRIRHYDRKGNVVEEMEFAPKGRQLISQCYRVWDKQGKLLKQYKLLKIPQSESEYLAEFSEWKAGMHRIYGVGGAGKHLSEWHLNKEGRQTIYFKMQAPGSIEAPSCYRVARSRDRKGLPQLELVRNLESSLGDTVAIRSHYCAPDGSWSLQVQRERPNDPGSVYSPATGRAGTNSILGIRTE